MDDTKDFKEPDPIDYKLHNEDELQKELEHLFNRLSIDSDLNTPDFILAEYVVCHLMDIKLFNKSRDDWFKK